MSKEVAQATLRKSEVQLILVTDGGANSGGNSNGGRPPGSWPELIRETWPGQKN